MLKNFALFFAGALLTGAYFVASPYFAEVPASDFTSEAAREASAKILSDVSPHMATLIAGNVDDQRQVLDNYLYGPRIEEARQLYSVDESVREIGGVYTEVFEPAGGIAAKNAQRVLINLHGGAFKFGARTSGRLESIPVADVANMRVVSVDYRQGPEHRFPAASEDVAAVYRELLNSYAPEQIGIFGCSAGGILTAQSMAWFQARGLPLPGAIGILCAGAGRFDMGDSVTIVKAFNTESTNDIEKLAYFDGVDWKDPLVFQLGHDDVLKQFPPTLIINSTRDTTLSTALATHQQLVANGVVSELHVFDGLNHAFFMDTDIPESRQVFDLIARFFDRHLAR